MFKRKKKPADAPAFLGHPYPDYLAMRARADAVLVASAALEAAAGPRFVLYEGPGLWVEQGKGQVLEVAAGESVLVQLDPVDRMDVRGHEIIQLARYIEAGAR